jgi:hypothetical protein
MYRDELRAFREGGMICPGCKARLRLREIITGYERVLLMVSAFLLAFLIPHWLGAKGNSMLYWGIVLMIPVSVTLGAAVGILHAVFSPPQLERDFTPGCGNILNLGGTPDNK